MTQPAKSQEPSMEEILASIRRIIADDDASKSTQKAPEPPVGGRTCAAADPRQSRSWWLRRSLPFRPRPKSRP